MRLVVACSSVSLALALPACSSTKTVPAGLPPTVGNGIGSQYGNYAAQADGFMLGPSGERCGVFNWDRPLADGRVIRLRSASCESKEHPRWLSARELSRTIIPLSESNLADQQPED